MRKCIFKQEFFFFQTLDNLVSSDSLTHTCIETGLVSFMEVCLKTGFLHHVIMSSDKLCFLYDLLLKTWLLLGTHHAGHHFYHKVLISVLDKTLCSFSRLTDSTSMLSIQLGEQDVTPGACYHSVQAVYSWCMFSCCLFLNFKKHVHMQ